MASEDELEDLVNVRPISPVQTNSHSILRDALEKEWDMDISMFEPENSLGPKIGNSEVVGKVKKMFTRALSEKNTKLMLEQTKVPEDCTFLATKRVNPEIWALADGKAHSADIRAQNATNRLTRGQVRILQAMESINTMATNVDEDGCRVMPTQDTFCAVLRDLRTASCLLGQAFIDLNNLRRYNFKHFISNEMKLVATEVSEELPGDLLFGEDLGKKVSQIQERSKVKEHLNALKPKYPSATGKPKSAAKDWSSFRNKKRSYYDEEASANAVSSRPSTSGVSSSH